MKATLLNPDPEPRPATRVSVELVGAVADAADPAAGGKILKTVWTGDGIPFVFLLNAVLTEHPGIDRAFRPGDLVIRLNGQAPDPLTPVHDGDMLEISPADPPPK